MALTHRINLDLKPGYLLPAPAGRINLTFPCPKMKSQLFTNLFFNF